MKRGIWVVGCVAMAVLLLLPQGTIQAGRSYINQPMPGFSPITPQPEGMFDDTPTPLPTRAKHKAVVQEPTATLWPTAAPVATATWTPAPAMRNENKNEGGVPWYDQTRSRGWRICWPGARSGSASRNGCL